MGKGDKRSKRGKIFAGTYGKTRVKPQTLTRLKKIEGQKAEKPAKKGKK